MNILLVLHSPAPPPPRRQDNSLKRNPNQLEMVHTKNFLCPDHSLSVSMITLDDGEWMALGRWSNRYEVTVSRVPPHHHVIAMNPLCSLMNRHDDLGRRATWRIRRTNECACETFRIRFNLEECKLIFVLFLPESFSPPFETFTPHSSIYSRKLVVMKTWRRCSRFSSIGKHLLFNRGGNPWKVWSNWRENPIELSFLNHSKPLQNVL